MLRKREEEEKSSFAAMSIQTSRKRILVRINNLCRGFNGKNVITVILKITKNKPGKHLSCWTWREQIVSSPAEVNCVTSWHPDTFFCQTPSQGVCQMLKLYKCRWLKDK